MLFAKNPFSPLNREEAWDLHNYALAHGIRGRKWMVPFSKGERELLCRMEALRQKLTSPVVHLRDGLAAARNARQSVMSVVGFLQDIRASQTVSLREKRLYQQGMQEEAIREGQVLEQLMELFAQMASLWGKERIPLGRLPNWMAEGLSMTELSALPPLENSVQVGMMGQLMPKAPKNVYLLGLNNGVLSLTDEALIADCDRILLEEGMGLKLNLKLPDREAIKQLDLWKSLTLSRENLWLSYALGGDDGSPQVPLSHIHRIQRMFPLLKEEGGALAALDEAGPLSPVTALNELAGLLYRGKLPPPWADV